jgi:hypothetical protein
MNSELEHGVPPLDPISVAFDAKHPIIKPEPPPGNVAPFTAEDFEAAGGAVLLYKEGKPCAAMVSSSN